MVVLLSLRQLLGLVPWWPQRTFLMQIQSQRTVVHGGLWDISLCIIPTNLVPCAGCKPPLYISYLLLYAGHKVCVVLGRGSQLSSWWVWLGYQANPCYGHTVIWGGITWGHKHCRVDGDETGLDNRRQGASWMTLNRNCLLCHWC